MEGGRVRESSLKSILASVDQHSLPTTKLPVVLLMQLMTLRFLLQLIFFSLVCNFSTPTLQTLSPPTDPLAADRRGPRSRRASLGHRASSLRTTTKDMSSERDINKHASDRLSRVRPRTIEEVSSRMHR